MARVRFVRCTDGLMYSFVEDGRAVSSRPFDDAGLGERAPERVWVSCKRDRSYVYDFTCVETPDSLA